MRRAVVAVLGPRGAALHAAASVGVEGDVSGLFLCSPWRWRGGRCSRLCCDLVGLPLFEERVLWGKRALEGVDDGGFNGVNGHRRLGKVSCFMRQFYSSGGASWSALMFCLRPSGINDRRYDVSITEASSSDIRAKPTRFSSNNTEKNTIFKLNGLQKPSVFYHRQCVFRHLTSIFNVTCDLG